MCGMQSKCQHSKDLEEKAFAYMNHDKDSTQKIETNQNKENNIALGQQYMKDINLEELCNKKASPTNRIANYEDDTICLAVSNESVHEDMFRETSGNSKIRCFTQISVFSLLKILIYLFALVFVQHLNRTELPFNNSPVADPTFLQKYLSDPQHLYADKTLVRQLQPKETLEPNGQVICFTSKFRSYL